MPMDAHYPILEFDGAAEAVIEPSKVIQPVPGMPERCVLIMYHAVVEGLRKQNRLSHIANINSSMGPFPIYRLTHEGADIAVVHPGLGAPLAGAVMEETIARGCRKFIACGCAGVLDTSLAKGTVVVPNAAVRDEGTSYHYASPAREISADPTVVKIIEFVLTSRGVQHRTGKTWTTDAFYRETKDRVARRKAEGCLTVEMECAAFLAIAAFRKAQFGQILGTDDDVSGVVWDPRHSEEHKAFPETLFWCAVEACLKL